MTLTQPVYLWLIILIVCLVAEAATTQLITIWFAAGCIGALLAVTLGFGTTVQFAVFLIASFAMLLVLRPLLRGALRTRQDKTNADRILDQTAIVIETIDNQHGTGQIRLMGQIWTARNIEKDVMIPEGETVVVRDISGVKAMVERCQTNGGGKL